MQVLVARASAALFGAGLLACGCSGSRFVVPTELPGDAPRYSLLVDYESFATNAPRQRVQLTPLSESGPAGACRPSFRVTGQLDELPAEPAIEERGFWVSRRRGRFDYQIAGPRATGVELKGSVERTTTERVDRRAQRAGKVTVEDGRIAYEEGHGTLLRGGEPMGEVTLQGSALSVDWAGTHYVAATRGYGGRAVRRDGTLAVYAKLDWGHWGVGERAFHVVADPSLGCDELERAVSVLLMSQLFAAE